MSVDQRLVDLAKRIGGRVVTNDFNLNKVASVQGVEVVNLNDVANALKPPPPTPWIARPIISINID